MVTDYAVREHLGIVLPKNTGKSVTAEEAMKEYYRSPRDTVSRERILEKWDQLSVAEIKMATTPDEVCRLFSHAPNGNSLSQHLAIEKMTGFIPE